MIAIMTTNFLKILNKRIYFYSSQTILRCDGKHVVMNTTIRWLLSQMYRSTHTDNRCRLYYKSGGGAYLQ